MSKLPSDFVWVLFLGSSNSVYVWNWVKLFCQYLFRCNQRALAGETDVMLSFTQKYVKNLTKVFTAWFIVQDSSRPHLLLEASPHSKSHRERARFLYTWEGRESYPFGYYLTVELATWVFSLSELAVSRLMSWPSFLYNSVISLICNSDIEEPPISLNRQFIFCFCFHAMYVKLSRK